MLHVHIGTGTFEDEIIHRDVSLTSARSRVLTFVNVRARRTCDPASHPARRSNPAIPPRCGFERPVFWTRPKAPFAIRSFLRVWGQCRRPYRRKRTSILSRRPYGRQVRCRDRRGRNTVHFGCGKNRAAWHDTVRERPLQAYENPIVSLSVDSEIRNRSTPAPYG